MNRTPFIVNWITLVTCLLLLAPSLTGQALPSQLRDLLPGDSPAAANERQYLYGELRTLFANLRKEEKLDRRSTKKKVKKLREYLGEKVLETYDPDASLVDIFQRGAYNDATAIALTALTLAEFDVENKVYVDHFYTRMVADPAKKQIALSFYPAKIISTAAKKDFVSNYIDLLTETVMPELAEQSPAAPADIFNSYYYDPNDDLNLRQLGAYLQLRSAQAAYDRGELPAALDALAKANAREERSAFLVFEQAIQTKLDASKERPVSGSLEEMFAIWNEQPDHEAAPSAILRHFDEQQRLALTSNNPEITRGLLASYLSRAPLGQIKWERQMMQLQSLRLLEHFIAAGQLSRARGEAADLYAGFPDSTQYRQMLGSLIIAEVNQESLNGEAFKQRLLQLAGEYPFLLQTGQFANIGLREQALTIRDLYANDRPDLALPAVESFRASLHSLTVDGVRSLWTMTTFYAASDYHFRIGDYAGALRFIDEALSFAPSDPFLNHRRSVLVKYL